MTLAAEPEIACQPPTACPACGAALKNTSRTLSSTWANYVCNLSLRCEDGETEWRKSGYPCGHAYDAAVKLRAALIQASTRLWKHHEAGYRPVLGEYCRVCWPDLNDQGGNIFLAIEDALKPYPEY